MSWKSRREVLLYVFATALLQNLVNDQPFFNGYEQGRHQEFSSWGPKIQVRFIFQFCICITVCVRGIVTW